MGDAKSRELVIEALRAEGGEANISRLARRSGLNYYLLERMIEALKKEGVIEERRIGRLRILRLCDPSRRASSGP